MGCGGANEKKSKDKGLPCKFASCKKYSCHQNANSRRHCRLFVKYLLKKETNHYLVKKMSFDKFYDWVRFSPKAASLVSRLAETIRIMCLLVFTIHFETIVKNLVDFHPAL